MKTKVTWKASGPNAKVLKIDDTLYDHFPEVDEVIEFKDEQYRVAGIESAVVTLEAVPAAPEVVDEPVIKQKPKAVDVPKAAPSSSRSVPLSQTAHGNKVVSHKKK
jgi:hypothetical protein